MSKKIKGNQLVARPQKLSKLLLKPDVKMPDQSTINLLSRSVAGLSPNSRAVLIGKILRDGLETRKVVRLEYAHVVVDDSGVRAPWLDWFPETVQSLGEIWYDGPIYRAGDIYGELSAFRAIGECISVPGRYDYLVAFGYEGGPDGSWTIVAVKEVEMIKLRDGTYISVVEFHADPRAHLLAPV